MYIACDKLFGVRLFEHKPIRKIFPKDNFHRKEENILGIWIDPINGCGIYISNRIVKLLFDNNRLFNCHIPLNKRNIDWGDNPVYVDLISE